MEIKFRVTWVRLLLVLWVCTAATLMAQEVLRVDRLIATTDINSAGTITSTGAVTVGGQQVINSSGQLIATRLSNLNISQFTNDSAFISNATASLAGTAITSGTVPDARLPANLVRTTGDQTLAGILTVNNSVNLGAGTNNMLANWVYDTGGLGGGAPIVRPAFDNIGSVGQTSFRWSLVRATTITPGDLSFENGWTFTETYKVGVSRPGIALLDPNDTLVAVIGQKGFEPGNNIPFVRTTSAQRAAMISEEQRKILRSQSVIIKGRRITQSTDHYLSPPDPKFARVGGAVDKRQVPRRRL